MISSLCRRWMRSNFIGWRFARQSVEAIEQSVVPQPNRIVFFQKLERADAARPLERSENGVVCVERLSACEERLRRQRAAQRRETGTKRRKLRLAAGGERFQRHSDAFFATRSKIVAVLG